MPNSAEEELWSCRSSPRQLQEEWGEEIERKHGDHQDTRYYETHRDDPPLQRAGAHLILGAHHTSRTITLPVTEAEACGGEAKKIGLIGREPGQIPDPRAAHPDPEQHKRYKAASRRRQRAEYATTGKKPLAEIEVPGIHLGL